jgi:uncharacterized protein (DUF433 family)
MVAWQDHLTRDPQGGGQVCAKGTRVPVGVILDSLAEGSDPDEVLRSYPSLKREHIGAALAYAAELAREETLIPLRGE